MGQGEGGATSWTQKAASSLRMSKLYRLQSSFATTKLRGSIGFQHSALLRVCITTLRRGELWRRSYSATLRSLPAVANTCGSACTAPRRVRRGAPGRARACSAQQALCPGGGGDERISSYPPPGSPALDRSPHSITGIGVIEWKEPGWGNVTHSITDVLVYCLPYHLAMIDRIDCSPGMHHTEMRCKLRLRTAPSGAGPGAGGVAAMGFSRQSQVVGRRSWPRTQPAACTGRH